MPDPKPPTLGLSGSERHFARLTSALAGPEASSTGHAALRLDAALTAATERIEEVEQDRKLAGDTIKRFGKVISELQVEKDDQQERAEKAERERDEARRFRDNELHTERKDRIKATIRYNALRGQVERVPHLFAGAKNLDQYFYNSKVADDHNRDYCMEHGDACLFTEHKDWAEVMERRNGERRAWKPSSANNSRRKYFSLREAKEDPKNRRLTLGRRHRDNINERRKGAPGRGGGSNEGQGDPPDHRSGCPWIPWLRAMKESNSAIEIAEQEPTCTCQEPTPSPPIIEITNLKSKPPFYREYGEVDYASGGAYQFPEKQEVSPTCSKCKQPTQQSSPRGAWMVHKNDWQLANAACKRVVCEQCEWTGWVWTHPPPLPRMKSTCGPCGGRGYDPKPPEQEPDMAAARISEGLLLRGSTPSMMFLKNLARCFQKQDSVIKTLIRSAPIDTRDPEPVEG